MVWFQRINFNQLKNIIFLILFDVKIFLKNLYFLFLSSKKYFLIFLLIIPIITFFLIYTIFFAIFWFLFFNLKYYFIRFLNISTIMNMNWRIPLFFLSSIKKSTFYYLFYFNPKAVGFIFMYDLHKRLWDSNDLKLNLPVYIFYLISITSLRFIIKFVTTFSFLSLKIALDVASSLHELSFYKSDNYSIYIDNFLYSLNVNYFFERWGIIRSSNINIYCSDFISFNGKWIENVFKDIDNVKKTLFLSDRMFKFWMVGDPAHPSASIIINKEKPYEPTIIQQSSNKIMEIKSFSGKLYKKSADIFVEKGLLNKPAVYDYHPFTVNLQKNPILLKPISNPPLYPNDILVQKKQFLKAIFTSFYKSDLVLVENKICESSDYNLFIDRLMDSYVNNTLHPNLIPTITYLLDFTELNKMYNDPIKISLWNHITKTAIVTNDGFVYLDDDKDRLPIDLKISIDSILK